MKTVKTFTLMGAQGDLLICRIDALPQGVTPVKPENGCYVVAHSETGHNHVIKATQSVELFSDGNPMISYLRVVESCDAVETVLKHLRSFDTHEPILIPPGVYEIRRQREHTPEGWRRVED